MIMHNLRTTMKDNGESLKDMVDTVVSENVQEVDKIEQSLLENLQSQDATFDGYISYLYDFVEDLYDCLSSSKLINIVPKLSEKFKEIQPIPETTKPVKPVFAPGRYSKYDVAKLLGKIKVKSTKVEVRKIKPMTMVYSNK